MNTTTYCCGEIRKIIIIFLLEKGTLYGAMLYFQQ